MTANRGKRDKCHISTAEGLNHVTPGQWYKRASIYGNKRTRCIFRTAETLLRSPPLPKKPIMSGVVVRVEEGGRFETAWFSKIMASPLDLDLVRV